MRIVRPANASGATEEKQNDSFDLLRTMSREVADDFAARHRMGDQADPSSRSRSGEDHAQVIAQRRVVVEAVDPGSSDRFCPRRGRRPRSADRRRRGPAFATATCRSFEVPAGAEYNRLSSSPVSGRTGLVLSLVAI